MNNRETIVNELKELSRVLADSNPLVPYQVPPGYFEQLPGKILFLVQSTKEDLTGLKEAKQNPYAVPQGYFENLADTVLKKIKAAEAGSAKEEIETLSPFLSRLNKKVPYNVPPGYFEELAGNVTEGAKAIELVNEELENLSPLMNGLKEKNVYDVPMGYFDTLANDLLGKAKLQQPGKIVSIGFSRKILHYAAAAVIAGLIFTAGWMIINKDFSSPGEVSAATETQEKVKKVSDEELQHFIETENSSIDEPVATTAASQEIDATDMKEMLADVSDEELQLYVDQTNPENNNSITN